MFEKILKCNQGAFHWLKNWKFKLKNIEFELNNMTMLF